MLTNTFNQIKLLELLIAHPGLSTNKPNIPALQAKLTQLQTKVTNYLDGMGVPP